MFWEVLYVSFFCCSLETKLQKSYSLIECIQTNKSIGWLISRQKAHYKVRKQMSTAVHYKHKSEIWRSPRIDTTKAAASSFAPNCCGCHPSIREEARSRNQFTVMNDSVQPQPPKLVREPKFIRCFSCCRSAGDCMVMGSATSYQQPAPASIQLEKQVCCYYFNSNSSYSFPWTYPTLFSSSNLQKKNFNRSRKTVNGLTA